MEEASKIKCLVCGSRTISKRGISDICPVCFWEDEGEIEAPHMPTHGPNGELSLKQAIENYKEFGAVEKRFVPKVRPPKPEEL